MGWNDWNTFGCDVSEKLVEQTADALISTGLHAKGYDYVNIDDCWSAKQRDASGQLVPDPAKFPDGIKAVADYVHARGLKLGLYADAGTATCAGYPGSLGHEQTDAQTFASWGVDLLKYDNCNNEGLPAQQRYQAMADALNATGRHIVYSICEWGVNKPWDWAPGMGDYWRIDGDINPDWDSVKSIGRQLMRHYNGWAGPGFPDPDMLEIGTGALTPTEERTHFGLWAMYGAPLILGADLRNLPAGSLSVVSNSDVIAVDQQAAGHAVRQVSATPGQYVLARAMNDGSTIVALYNEGDSPAPLSTTAAAAGLPAAPAYRVKDLWTGAVTSTTGDLTQQVPAHGLTLLRVNRTDSPRNGSPVVTMDAPRGPGVQEFLAGPQGAPVRVSVTAPRGGPALRDLSVKLSLPTGWTTSDSLTQAFPPLRPGATKTSTWTVTPSGTSTGEATATVTWTDAQGTSARAVALDLTPTPATPTGQTSVAALPWIHAWSGYASPQRNTGIEGQTLSVNGQTFATGVGSHAESEIAVWLGGNCTRLTTSVGLQDGTNAGASIQGSVEGDGKTLASSGVMSAGMSAQPLDVNVTGVKYLVLHTVGGSSTYGGRVVWGGTQLSCAGLSVAGATTFVASKAGNVTTSVTAPVGGATSVTNQLTGPSGWTITPATPASSATVAAGDTFTTTWAVTPPAGLTGGTYQLTGQTSYVADGKTVTESKALTVGVARSAHYVYSQKYDGGPSYKRLTRDIAVPSSGGALTFWVDRDTEDGWDYMFVEAHTPGQNDWTTLPDANGHTSTDPGDSCAAGWVTLHPQLAHYQTWDGSSSCTSAGTTGSWNAATGRSSGWEQWKMDLSKWAGQTVEVSIAYASDWGGQGNGVFISDPTLPDGTAATFDDGLDGWAVSGAPAGDPPNPNDWTIVDATQYPAQ